MGRLFLPHTIFPEADTTRADVRPREGARTVPDAFSSVDVLKAMIFRDVMARGEIVKTADRVGEEFLNGRGIATVSDRPTERCRGFSGPLVARERAPHQLLLERIGNTYKLSKLAVTMLTSGGDVDVTVAQIRAIFPGFGVIELDSRHIDPLGENRTAEEILGGTTRFLNAKEIEARSRAVIGDEEFLEADVLN